MKDTSSAEGGIRVEPFRGFKIRCIKCGVTETYKSKQLANMRAGVIREEHRCAR